MTTRYTQSKVGALNCANFFMAKPQNIFWDVYGTLIAAVRGDLDSLVRREKELRAAFEKSIRTFDLRVEPATLHDLFLRCLASERHARNVPHPEVRIDEIWYALLQKFHPQSPVTANLAQEVALAFERAANPKTLMPGAFDVLVELKRRGHRQGIISNAQFYTPIELSALLRVESDCASCAYESIFDPARCVFSYQWGRAKPDLAIFHQALGDLNPADCVMIGDSLANDITPARELGLQTIHFGTDIQNLTELLTRL